jgi:hypothetical protein
MSAESRDPVFLPNTWVHQSAWVILKHGRLRNERSATGDQQWKAVADMLVRLHRFIYPSVGAIPACTQSVWWTRFVRTWETAKPPVDGRKMNALSPKVIVYSIAYFARKLEERRSFLRKETIRRLLSFVRWFAQSPFPLLR